MADKSLTPPIDETEFINEYARQKEYSKKSFKNWLVETILEAKEAYYVKGSPFISDGTYDLIEIELQKIDPHHPVLQLVGYSEEIHEAFVNGEF